MKLKSLITISILLTSLSACGENNEQSKTPPPKKEPIQTAGYEAYIFACTADNVPEYICKCQANILSREISDDKIYLLAEAGANASQGDESKIDYIMANHPEIIVAMGKLSNSAEICAQ